MSARPLRDAALAALLLFAYGWLFVFFPKLNNPNELVRLYLARAIAERGTYAIGERVQAPGGGLTDTGPLFAEWGWVNDKALVCNDPSERPPGCAGTLTAAKAPGTSLLEVPVVLALDRAYAALGHRRPTKDEYVFWCRWAVAILPSVLFWLLLRRLLRALGVDEPLALLATLAGACGSLSLTYGQLAAGHQLASLFLGAGFAAAFWPAGGAAQPRSRAALVGFALGAAVCTEYPAAPAGLLIGLGWLAHARPGLRGLLRAALGAALPLGLLAHFHAAAFGAPWRTPYSALENPGFVRDIAPGVLGISLPDGERVWGSLFSPTLGLFFWAPWTLLALPAGWLVWRGAPGAAPAASPRPALGARLLAEAPALTAFAVVGYFLLFQVNHSLWRSGWTVGPRYITPLVPFAAVVVAIALQRLPVAARPLGAGLLAGAAVAAIGATGLASAVCQGFPFEAYNPLPEIVARLLARGWLPRNPLQALGVPGLWSGLPYFGALAGAALLCLRAPLQLAGPLRRRGFWLGLALAALLSLGQWTARAGRNEQGPRGADFLASQWAPEHPPGAEPF